jgi:ribosomal protein L40E
MSRPSMPAAHLLAVASQGPRMEEIICKRCGAHAAVDESFCGSCGAFLEWEGERVVVEAGTPTEVPASAAHEHPVAAPPAGPVAVQPAPPLERAKPRSPSAPVRRAEPGDIFCGQCGHFNDPERRFCRRCGSRLDNLAMTVRLPWWKRIFHRRQPDHKKAETRMGGRGRGAAGGGAPGRAARTGKTPPGSAAFAAGSSPRPGILTGPKALSTKYSPVPRLVPEAWSAPPAVRIPVGPAARPHRLRGKLLVLAVLVAVVFSVDPAPRHTAVNWYSRAFHRIVPSYSKVPVEHVGATRFGDCGPPLLQSNDTVYWYTQPGGDGLQLLTITVAPNFAGTISKIAFTPLNPPVHAPQSGRASPYPEQISLSSSPAGIGTVVNLNNPPTFQQESIKVVRPSEVVLRLVATDPGAAPATCAETGIVLYERTN